VVRDIKNLKDFKGPCLKFESGGGAPVPPSTTDSWADCITSVRVSSGWRATFYGDEDFKGMRLEVTADLPNLRFVPGGDFNDGVSSIRILPP
jgi:hypothetical protein